MPVVDARGAVAESSAVDGRSYPIFRVAADSPLVRRVYDVLQSSFAHEVIKLDRYARNLVLSERRGEPPVALTAPAYLLMSQEEGGFSRQGLWLQGVSGQRRLVPASYVDLVVTERSVESGNFEEIFSHELGHQILRELVGALPPGWSRNMHQSMAVTDYPTAFDEGYAEHFQPLVGDATTNPRLRAASEGTTATDLDRLWISRLDQQLRTDGVKANVFIHRKALPAAALDSTADRYSLYLDDETSTAFLDDQLKSGQEMLASEGVIATLFYRIVHSRTLREHRRDAAFYRQFLADSASISPYENVNLKLFLAMRRAVKAIASGAPPMIALVESYATTFPDEAHAIDAVFLETTRGATVSQPLAHAFEQAAAAGRRGDIATFRPASRAAFALLDSTNDRVTHGEIAVGANLGPELWLLNEDFKIGSAIWDADRTLPLTINLNTATEAELMTIGGVDLNTARRIIELRRARGFFHGVDDLAAVVSPAVYRALVAMHDAMAAARPQPRP
jgi:hypothetical protein